MHRICVLLTLVFILTYDLCQAQESADGNSILNSDINTIAKEASALKGKVVSIIGIMNECYPGVYESCEICNAEKPREIYEDGTTCLNVAFRHSREADFARFATVRLIGEVKYNPPPKMNENGVITISTGIKNDIINAKVEDVIIRRSPREGHVPRYEYPSLKEADLGESVALRTAFIANFSYFSEATIGDIHYAYLVVDDFIYENLRDKIQDRLLDESGGGPISSDAYLEDPEYKSFGGRGGVCVCKDEVDTCKSIWPTHLNHTYLLPTDTPYECWDAEKINGTWKIVLP